MTKFSIEYNPYLAECVFKINGIRVSDGSKIGAKSKNRLQVLLGESDNWEGLLEEIVSICDDPEIELFFKGRRIDYDDLVYEVDRYKKREEDEKKDKKAKFYLQKCDEVKKDEDIIGELDKIFVEIEKKDLPMFREKNKKGESVFDVYREVKNGKFEISVIATMSSGKSTLVNSLLHTELLPSENKACTATITRILDNDDMVGYEAECYDEKKQMIYPRQIITPAELRNFNSSKEVKYIDIEGSIPSIPSDAIRLCLRDTPGPNNSEDEEHKALTESVIRRMNSVILYVMNVTQMKIEDDKELLGEIAEEMKGAGKESRDRFIFVVNKCDELDEEKGESVDKTIEEAKKYLREFEIVDPILIPMSARTALLIHKKRNGEDLTKKEKNNVSETRIEDWVDSELLHYERYASSLTPTVRAKLEENVKKCKENEEKEMEALIHTGVPALEETICEYIKKYAYPIKIKDAVKNIVDILDELEMNKKFEERIAADKGELKNIQKQIAKAKEKHKKSEKIYGEYRSNIKKLRFDEIDEDSELAKVELEMGNITKEYDGINKVDKSKADEMIEIFQAKLEKCQSNCEKRLNEVIEKKLFNECNAMLEEYSKTINEVLDGIQIDGYDFKKVASFKKLQTPDIEEMKRQNEVNRYRDETRWKDNPERKSFLGKFKFWKPKKVSYTVSVKDGVDIDIHNLIIDIGLKFAENMKQNISNLFKKALEELERYKNIFIANIEKLHSEIEKILKDLQEKTEDGERLNENLEKNKEMLDWIMEQDKKIRAILEF